jgi:SET domain-containing protein
LSENFDKDLLVVRVIKDIEAGEEIFNCYGKNIILITDPS